MFFLEISCFFDDLADVGNLISGSSAFSKTSLNIWKFMDHALLKPGLENLEHYFTSMWDECNCVVVWTFFGITFLWDWNENWPFPVLWPLLGFQICWHIDCNIFTASSFSIETKPCPVGPPKIGRHGGEVWQNVVHWRREWQTTSVFLPWEPHEQYEKAK